MAGQFPYSSAAGEIIIKGILAKLDMTIPQLSAATGLGYSALQRLYNGETKRITQPVYDALKKRWPHLRDEYLKSAELPVFDNEDETPKDSFSIIDILQNARRILDDVVQRSNELKRYEQELNERARRLDERAAQLDQIALQSLQRDDADNPVKLV